MPTIEVLRPTNFEEYVKMVGDANIASSERCWYRGASKASHHLQSGLYRLSGTKTPEQWSSLEEQMMLTFAQRSMPFVDQPVGTWDATQRDWSTLFYMQHYKIPTRLLDWSENPFVALFFASTGPFVPSHTAASKEIEFEHDAVVWLLNPVKWNRTAWSHLTWTKGIAFTNEANLKGYQPPFESRNLNDLPIAMHGSHNSRRIVAQRGVFTVFGASPLAMDKQFEANDKFTDELVKIVIDKALIPKFRKALFSYGITESVIYPDLEGLAHEIKRDFGYED